MESLVSPTVVDDAYDAPVDHEDDNEGIRKPKRKRQKKSKKPDSIVGSEFKNVRGRRGALYYLPQFFAGDSIRLQAILPSFNAIGNEVDEVSREDQDAVVICVMSAAKMRAEFLGLDHEAQASWIRAKTKERKDRISHGILCQNWILRQTEIRALRLNDARQRRYKAIKQKLIDLGLGEELKFFHDFEQWPSVKQPKDLTERSEPFKTVLVYTFMTSHFIRLSVWLNIKNDLIEKLKNHRTLRLEKEYLAAQNERSHRLCDCLSKLRSSTPLRKRIFPPIADIRQMEPFSSLIMAPASEKIDFSQSMLEEATKNWRSSKETELRDMIISKSSPISCPASVDILSLATTFFKCWRSGIRPYCSRTIGFPEVLVHPCASKDDTTWNSDRTRIFFDQKAHSLAKTILEASGLDYNLTTREEIEHALSHPSQDTGLRMARANLSGIELSVVKELGNKQLLESQTTRYKCMRCEEADYTWYSLCTHVIYKYVSH
ncbi:hypothetical protein C0993_010501 [Termitomyces sp. T159_Od127]|nr:hypothetical protein C0993_010501 [Termitomyces sp. T159_Od127]